MHEEKIGHRGHRGHREKFFLTGLQDDWDFRGGGRFAGVGPLGGCCGATPCGSKPAVPSRSELLRAQTVLIRRLRRLAKLGLPGIRGGGMDRKILMAGGGRRKGSAVVALFDYTLPPSNNLPLQGSL